MSFPTLPSEERGAGPAGPAGQGQRPEEGAGTRGWRGPAVESLSYEELVEMLEDLARRMAAGDVGIEEAAELYEQAGFVHRIASERLERVRRRVEDLEKGTASPPS